MQVLVDHIVNVEHAGGCYRCEVASRFLEQLGLIIVDFCLDLAMLGKTGSGSELTMKCSDGIEDNFVWPFTERWP